FRCRKEAPVGEPLAERHVGDVVGRETEAVDAEQDLTDAHAARWSGPARVYARVVAPHDEIESLIGGPCHEATARPLAVAAGCGVAGGRRLSSTLPIWLRGTSTGPSAIRTIRANTKAAARPKSSVRPPAPCA